MKTPITIAAIALASISSAASAKPVSASQLQKEIKQLEQQTNALQQQVTLLKTQLKQHHKMPASHTQPRSHAKHLHGKASVPDEYASRSAHYFGGVPVITSPYLGVRSEFNAADLIVNISSINEDLILLKQRQKLENALFKNHLSLPQHPLIELSGKVEAVGFNQWPYVGDANGDIDLGGAEIDAAAEFNSWATGFISMTYDGSPPRIGGQRTSNSNIFLNKGFLTLGNLNHSPFYMTTGQLYVPFGRYASNMVSATLTQRLARTKARAVVFGYKHPGSLGPFAQAYAFNSDFHSGVAGANVGYDFDTHGVNGELAGGYISNVANSDGIQMTGGTGFSGFGLSSASEVLVHNVPAWDVNGRISKGNYTVLGEYIRTSRGFSPLDLTYNAHGAQPSAFNVELSRNFDLATYPSSVAVGYARTYQALGLNLPKSRYIAAFNISLWRDTIESLEYRHELNYPVGTLAGGRTGATTFAAATPMGTLGKTSDTITAQIGVYF